MAGLLTSGSSYSPRLPKPAAAGQWLIAGFVPEHSDGFVPDLHRFPSYALKGRHHALRLYFYLSKYDEWNVLSIFFEWRDEELKKGQQRLPHSYWYSWVGSMMLLMTFPSSSYADNVAAALPTVILHGPYK